MADPIFLPGVPEDLVRAAFDQAPGNEIATGKFLSPESSAALAANAFGWFLQRPAFLPVLPGLADACWPAERVELEAVLRFPWAGGRHPCLDVLVATETALIGIESKRYEPFRPKGPPSLSNAYWRPVWGERMAGYQRVRDGLRDGTFRFQHLDAAQLVKHALGLRTATHRPEEAGKAAVLVYVYAEPVGWPNGASINPADHAAHREEVSRFADLVAGDEVRFLFFSYRQLLEGWSSSGNAAVSSHAQAVLHRFAP
ncbi:hypothetical protein [Oleisolibacter albus]|uniref:hypothetical protein n=1 Tax=Oleisolibacter albus TaxID=2171757 RepID=UPI000DF1DA18|nr:hypothetical protein [Oleisolibacter albus]